MYTYISINGKTQKRSYGFLYCTKEGRIKIKYIIMRAQKSTQMKSILILRISTILYRGIFNNLSARQTVGGGIMTNCNGENFTAEHITTAILYFQLILGLSHNALHDPQGSW